MRRRSRIAAILAAPLLLVAGTTLAGPAAPTPRPGDAPAPSGPRAGGGGDEMPTSRPAPSSVPELRSRLESGMETLGMAAEEAKRDGDLVRATCAVDKQDRGRAVMEVATGELLVIQDSGSTPQQRAFAVEKLQAAADRMARLVEESGGCSGEAPLGDEDGVTRNEADQPRTIPVEDPTLGGGDPLVLPPVDSVNPVTVASPAR